MDEGFCDEANKLIRKYSAIVWKLEGLKCDHISQSLVPILTRTNPV